MHLFAGPTPDLRFVLIDTLQQIVEVFLDVEIHSRVIELERRFDVVNGNAFCVVWHVVLVGEVFKQISYLKKC